MNHTNSLTFYTANTPNGQKIAIFLNEAGLDYDQVNLDLSRGDQHQPSYRRINPNGKIPAIFDKKSGVTVFESGAILSYLSAKTGCLLPPTDVEQVAVQQWLHFQIGGIGPMLGQLWWFLHGSKTENPEAIQRYRKEALRLYQVVDARLSESAFIALPSYSIADIAAFAWLRTWSELSLDISPFSHVRRWLDLIESRPAVQQGLLVSKQEGSPFDQNQLELPKG